jgi:hypothetical protein
MHLPTPLANDVTHRRPRISPNGKPVPKSQKQRSGTVLAPLTKIRVLHPNSSLFHDLDEL